MPAITPLPAARVMSPVIAPVSVSNVASAVIDVAVVPAVSVTGTLLLGTSTMQCGAPVLEQPSSHTVLPLAQLSESPSHAQVGSMAGASMPASPPPVVHRPATQLNPGGQSPIAAHAAPEGAVG